LNWRHEHIAAGAPVALELLKGASLLKVPLLFVALLLGQLRVLLQYPAPSKLTPLEILLPCPALLPIAQLLSAIALALGVLPLLLRVWQRHAA
jgi:hypothetical protein